MCHFCCCGVILHQKTFRKGFQNATETTKKTNQNRITFEHRFFCDLPSILEGVGGQAGAKIRQKALLGKLWPPIGHPLGTLERFFSISHRFWYALVAIWGRFKSILERFLEGFGFKLVEFEEGLDKY